jgi:S-DNA-T family DNA segregation ATPase FtsK/SpoIIIE
VAASNTATTLLKNFLSEIDTYIEDFAEVLGVELRCEEWLTINGVDIPLPCHAVIDLAARLKDGRIAIIDHKSRASYTDEKDVALTRGKQAITYVKCFEAQTGMKVNEVWFVENKHSRNRDESPQMRCYKITLDKDTRRLYEAMLYEPLRRMVEAVGDPDYVFTINDSDTLSDKAELYDFWIKTMTAEVDDFAIPYDKRTLIAKRQKKIRDASMVAVSPRVISEFRRCAQSFITYDLSQSNMENKEKIEHVLRTFGIIVKVAHEIEGYSSTTYLLEASAGVKIANVARYKLDIAGALNVASVRICDNLMVYDGRSYLCVEVQHKRTKDLYFDPSYLDAEKIPIGVDNFGRTVVWDMNNQSTPHVLICGATGSGKSVSIISTLNYAKLAGVRDIIIFDPKCEFGRFAGKVSAFSMTSQT